MLGRGCWHYRKHCACLSSLRPGWSAWADALLVIQISLPPMIVNERIRWRWGRRHVGQSRCRCCCLSKELSRKCTRFCQGSDAARAAAPFAAPQRTAAWPRMTRRVRHEHFGFARLGQRFMANRALTSCKGIVALSSAVQAQLTKQLNCGQRSHQASQ